MAGAAVVAFAQTSPLTIDWRSAGNLSLDRGLAGFSTGPVFRVWYASDGSKLYAAGLGSRVFETADFEQWTASSASVPPPASDSFARKRPENGAKIYAAPGQGSRVYAAGRFVYRSDDEGANWTNLTAFRDRSILGDGILDVAVSPTDPDDVTAASLNGVWRSVDGGASWAGLNDGLANFPATRILSLPSGMRGMRVEANGSVFEWLPGERRAWRELADDQTLLVEAERHSRWSQQLGVKITASAVAGDVMYAGSADGRIFASPDRGATWSPFKIQEMGAITRIVADPQDPRVAVATAGLRPAELEAGRKGAHVLRTINGGVFWDDLTGDLPDVEATGAAFERASGALYVATSAGVYVTAADLNGLGPATPWRLLTGAWGASAKVLDVQLTAGGHQVYAAVEGAGVFAAAAPHRKGSPRMVQAADFSSRAAAPGSLLTLIGAEVTRAQAGAAMAPILASGAERSEIQVPFDVQGSTLSVSLETRGRSTPLQFGVPLQQASPAIFLDRDGAPMVLDAESGVMLDGLTPARSGNRIQVLAAGMGRVRPEWPAGVAAPLDSPPAVVAKVRAWLDRNPVDVTRAVLAPGYIGFYLIEIELPKIVNYGPAELYIEADGRESNRVRLYIEP